MNATQKKLDHSIFDADIHGQAMNFQYLKRIMAWVKPHALLVCTSILLVVLASLLAVFLPVIITRVAIDTIILDTPDALMPDFGMNSVNEWLMLLTGFEGIVTVCILYGVTTIACHGLYHLHRVTFAKTVLFALRDMRLDLFSHMEHRPSSFYDKVAVGRVMTRITNDVQALFELLMGVGMLIGEFVPFFLALALMLTIDVELTGYLLLSIPIFGVITYFFRLATRKVYRQIRNTVSQLNQNLQENLSGMQVVQLSNREERNLQVYSDINEKNSKQEVHAIQLETGYGAFMDNMVNLALAVIIWVGGSAVLSDAITVAHPSDSTTGNFLTMALRLAIRKTPKASVTVTQMGSPSGMAATAKLTAMLTVSKKGRPMSQPTTAIKAIAAELTRAKNWLSSSILI